MWGYKRMCRKTQQAEERAEQAQWKEVLFEWDEVLKELRELVDTPNGGSNGG